MSKTQANFASSAKDVLRFRRTKSLRPFIRDYGLRLLAQFVKAPQIPRLIFLSFHFTFEEDRENLRRILKFLSKHFEFISYSEAVQKWKDKNFNKNYVCFSSDDGFANYTIAAEVMKEFGATGMVFICPSMIGETNREKLASFNANRLNGPSMPFLSWNQIDELAKQGHEFGNHTFSHFNQADISQAESHTEIVKTHEIIQARLGTCNHFAWPYGKPNRIRPETIKFVYDLGYDSVASTVRGYYSKDVTNEQDYILRNNFEPFWPISHVKYFSLTQKFQ